MLAFFFEIYHFRILLLQNTRISPSLWVELYNDMGHH